MVFFDLAFRKNQVHDLQAASDFGDSHLFGSRAHISRLRNLDRRICGDDKCVTPGGVKKRNQKDFCSNVRIWPIMFNLQSSPIHYNDDLLIDVTLPVLCYDTLQ